MKLKLKLALSFLTILLISFNCLGADPIRASGWTTTTDAVIARFYLGFPQQLDYSYITNPPWASSNTILNWIAASNVLQNTTSDAGVIVGNKIGTNVPARVALKSDIATSNFVKHVDYDPVTVSNANNVIGGSNLVFLNGVFSNGVSVGTLNASNINTGSLNVTNSLSVSNANVGILTASNAVKIFSATNAAATNLLAVKPDGTVIGLSQTPSGPQFLASKISITNIYIASVSTTSTNWRSIDAGPQALIDAAIPVNAQSIILESYGFHGNATAGTISIRKNSLATMDYVLLAAWSGGGGDNVASNGQGVFSLDNVTGGHRSIQYRINFTSSAGEVFAINVIGYYY